jgi:hypothetical protein
LTEMEALGSDSGAPRQPIQIVDCGELSADDAKQ